MYSRWQPDRSMYFNSYFVEGDGENLLIDPLPADEPDIDQMIAAGGVAWVIVTNRDHERASSELAARFGARIAAGSPDAGELSRPPDRILRDGDEIGPARVITLEGLKTAGEFALHLSATRTVIAGDALWGDPVGSLRMMPDERLIDPLRAARSLCRLREVFPLNLLVGDGAPIFGRAYEAINACLERRSGAEVNRVNLDELRLRTETGPANYTVELAEIGFRLGAESLGYWTTRIGPGASSARRTGTRPKRSSSSSGRARRRLRLRTDRCRCGPATLSPFQHASSARTDSSTTATLRPPSS